MTTPTYDTDFYAWTQQQAAALRARDVAALDWDHLAEEVEDLGASQRHAVVSHLRVLLTHRLKWDHQEGRRTASWFSSMVNAQVEVETYLEEYPSLRPHLPTFVQRAYRLARRVAAKETGLAPHVFPDACPWVPDELLDPGWLPEKVG